MTSYLYILSCRAHIQCLVDLFLSTIQDPTLSYHNFNIGGKYKIQSVVGNRYYQYNFSKLERAIKIYSLIPRMYELPCVELLLTL